jgi:hypothetical protein
VAGCANAPPARVVSTPAAAIAVIKLRRVNARPSLVIFAGILGMVDPFLVNQSVAVETTMSCWREELRNAWGRVAMVNTKLRSNDRLAFELQLFARTRVSLS